MSFDPNSSTISFSPVSPLEALPEPVALPSRHLRNVLAGVALTTSVALSGCGSNVEAGPVEDGNQTTTTSAAATTGPVFFSPYGTVAELQQITDVPPTTVVLSLSEWAAGNCSPDLAADNVPAGTEFFGGFSLGRLGVIYYLQGANEEQLEDMEHVTLIDPGDTDDFTGGGCEEVLEGSSNDVSQTLAEWLASDPANRLTILAGEASQDIQNGTPTYRGLKDFYLDGIIGRPLEEQLLFCDYGAQNHEGTLRNFITNIGAPTEDCPATPDGRGAVRIAF